MKVALAFICLFTLACVNGADVTSAQLKHCPDGHTALKDVPISYGLPAPPDWKKFQRQIDNLEFVLGGCEIAPDAPMIRPTCRICRFGYDSRSKTWSRQSPDPNTFRRPFTAVLTSFPVPPHAQNFLYVQAVRSGRLIGEEVSFTTENSAWIKEQMRKWLQDRPEVFRRDTRRDAQWRPTSQTWKSPNISLLVDYEQELKHFFIWLRHDVR
jgi:hypothetical protein